MYPCTGTTRAVSCAAVPDGAVQWCQMIVCPRSAARAALVGGQRGLPEPEQGTSGLFRTSSTGRALLFAQDRRWEDLASIFVIALLDFNTLDQQL